jgi:hypothetical protein
VLALVPERPGVEPFFPPALYARGFSLLHAGDYPAALDAFAEALPRDPIAADAGGAAGINQVTGTVYAIEYQGAFVKVTMRVAGDDEFVAYLRDDVFGKTPVAAGDQATASWDRADLHLLRADLGRAAQDDSRPYQNP